MPSNNQYSELMKLKVIHATKHCAESTCPTIYRAEDGRYVIQGFKVKAEDRTGIPIPEGEDVVVLPKDFMEEFLAKK